MRGAAAIVSNAGRARRRVHSAFRKAGFAQSVARPIVRRAGCVAQRVASAFGNVRLAVRAGGLPRGSAMLRPQLDSMELFKAAVVGTGAAVLAAILWVAGWLFAPMLFQRAIGELRGQGGFGASSVGAGSALVVAILVFLAAFYLTFRRHSIG